MFFNFKKNYFLQTANLILLSSLFLSACSYSHKFTSYTEPQIVSSHESEQLISEIGILFVIDVSGTMSEEKKYLSENISKLASLFKNNNYSNYNFGITVMRSYDRHSAHDDILYTFPANFHESICDFNPETIQGFIQKSEIGSFFRFTSEDIAKYDPANLFCILSNSIEIGLPGNNDSVPSTGAPGRGGNGSSAGSLQNEHYFLPVEKALERLIPHKNDMVFQNFFGKDSYLTVIFISDASGDEYIYQLSKEGIDKYMNESAVSSRIAERFYSNITSYKLSSKFTRFYGVIPVSLEIDCGGLASYEATNYPPYHVLHLIKKTKGKFFPICDTEWGTHVDIISDDLDSFLKKKYFLLERIPKLSTLEVFYGGIKIESDIETGWYYNPENISITINSNIFKDHPKKSKVKLIIKYHPINSEVFFQEE